MTKHSLVLSNHRSLEWWQDRNTVCHAT